MSVVDSTISDSLVVADVSIRRDAEGRYCLNDLHRAAGGESRHQPAKWLVNQQTQELITELEKTGIPVILAKQGPGTFVCKDLVYEYAIYWLSSQQTIEIVNELLTTGNPVVTIEGRHGGTYVLKELVYAYAMWISPSFHFLRRRA